MKQSQSHDTLGGLLGLLRRHLFPLSAGLMMVLASYLVMTSLFKEDDKPATEGALKPTGRDRSATNHKLSSANGQEPRSSERVLKGDESESDSEKGGPEGDTKLKDTLAQKQVDPKDLVVFQKGQRSSSHFNNASLVVDKKGLLRAAILKESYRVALKAEEPSFNLNNVAAEYFRLGDRRKAREVLKKSLSLAVYPDDARKTTQAVSSVVRAMLSLEQFSLAEDALANIPDSSARQRAMGVAVSWSALHGELEMARRVMSSITVGSNRDSALVDLSANEAKFEDLSRAIQTSFSIADQKKRNTAYRRIAEARASLGDYHGSEQSLHHINDDQIREAAHVRIAKIRAKNGDVEGSLGTIQALKNQDVADISLKDLSRQLAVSGKFSNSAIVSNHIRGDGQRSEALENLSVAQAKSGDLSGSLTRVHSIPSDMIRNRSMIALSRITARQTTTGQARNIATMIASGVQRDRAYKVIAEAATAAGNHADAYNTTQQISRIDEKALTLVSLARTREKQGDSRASFAMLEDADRMAQSVDSGNALDRILSSMSTAYAERGESNHALSLAATISAVNQRDKSYQKLAEVFAVSDIDAAQFAVLSIRSANTKTKAEDNISRLRAKAYVKKGEVNKPIAEVRQLASSRQKIVFLLEVSKLL